MKATSGFITVEGGLRGRQVRRLGFAVAICAATAVGLATHIAPATHVTPSASAAHTYLVITTTDSVTGGPGTM